MKLAYLILAHRAPEQLQRLIKTLDSEENQFFIHFDRRAEGAYHQAKGLLGSMPNVHFLTKRYRCRWGQFSLVEAAIACLEAATASGFPFDFVSLISGQDYPIKSGKEINEFFQQHADKSFVEFFRLDLPNKWTDQGGPFQAMRRIGQWHFPIRSRWIHLPVGRKIPLGFLPFGGAQWWTLSKACADWTSTFLRTNPGFVRYFRYTFLPDESFFQTLLLNSPFADRIVNDNLRFVDFTRGHPTPPAILTTDDFDLLQSQKTALFARKFDFDQDRNIFDLIDQSLLKVV